MEKTKICSTCKMEYPATPEYFFRDSPRADGLKYICKKCSYKIYKDYYNKNQEKYAQLRQEYNTKNRDIINKLAREKYRNNREYNILRSKEYQKRNKEKVKDRQRKYNLRESTKKKWVIYSQHRRNLKKNLRSDLSNSKWVIIQNAFDNKCAYCGKEEKLTQDHFIPLSKGGEYSHDNIIPACMRCNSSKNNNDFFSWYPKQQFYNKLREKKILSFLHYSKNRIQQLSLL